MAGKKISELDVEQIIPDGGYFLINTGNNNKLVRIPVGNFHHASEEFLFNTPSAQWIVNHNRGYIPVINIITLGGLEMEGDIHHVSNNQTIIGFNAPVSGKVNIK